MSSLAMAAASIKRSESPTSLSTPHSYHGGLRGQRSFSRQGSVSSRQSSFGYGSTRGGISSVCKFYLQGRCNRGSSCPFSHQQPNYSSFSAKTKPQSVCKFFLKGKCKRGSSCTFRHELNDDDTISVVTMGSGVPVQYAPPRQMCKYFANGFCSRGSTCNFLHESISNNSIHVPIVSYGNVPAARSQPAYSTTYPSVPKEKPTIEAIRARAAAARAKEAATPSLSSFAQAKISGANGVAQVESQIERVNITDEPAVRTSLLTATDDITTPMKSNHSKPDSPLQSCTDDHHLVLRDKDVSSKESIVSNITESADHAQSSNDHNEDKSKSDATAKEHADNFNSVADVTPKEAPENPQSTTVPKTSSLLAAMSACGAKTAPTLKKNLTSELVKQQPISKEAPCTIAPKTEGESQESDSSPNLDVGFKKTQSPAGSFISQATIIAPQETTSSSLSAAANASKRSEDKNDSGPSIPAAASNGTSALQTSSLPQASSSLSAATSHNRCIDSLSKTKEPTKIVTSYSNGVTTIQSNKPPIPTTNKVSSLQAAAKSHNTRSLQSVKPISSLSPAVIGQSISSKPTEEQNSSRAKPKQGKSSLVAALHSTSSNHGTARNASNSSLAQRVLTSSLSAALSKHIVQTLSTSSSNPPNATSLATSPPLLQNSLPPVDSETSTAQKVDIQASQQNMDGDEKVATFPDSTPTARAPVDFNGATKPKSSLALMTGQSQASNASNPYDQQKVERPVSSLLAAASQSSNPKIATESKSSLTAASSPLATKTSSLQRYSRNELGVNAAVSSQSTTATVSLASASVQKTIHSIGSAQSDHSEPESSVMPQANRAREVAKPTYSSLFAASSKQSLPKSSLAIASSPSSSQRYNQKAMETNLDSNKSVEAKSSLASASVQEQLQPVKLSSSPLTAGCSAKSGAKSSLAQQAQHAQEVAKPTYSSLLAAASTKKPLPKSSLAAASSSTKTSSLQRCSAHQEKANAAVSIQSAEAKSTLPSASSTDVETAKEPVEFEAKSEAAKSSLMPQAQHAQDALKPTYSSLLAASTKQSPSLNIRHANRSKAIDTEIQSLSYTPKSNQSPHSAPAWKKSEVSMSSLAIQSSTAQRCSPRESVKGQSSSSAKPTISSLKAAFESPISLSWAARTLPKPNPNDESRHANSSFNDVQNPLTVNNEQLRLHPSALNKASSFQAKKVPTPTSSNDDNTEKPLSENNSNSGSEITELYGMSSGLVKLSPAKLMKPKKRWGDESESDSD